MDFYHKTKEMSRRDHSFELVVNHLIKQTNGSALPDIQGIPTESDRAGVLPFYKEYCPLKIRHIACFEI